MGVKHFVLGVNELSLMGVNELCSWTLPLDVSIRLTQDVIISNLLSCASRITSCLPRRLNFLLLLPFLLPFIYLFLFFVQLRCPVFVIVFVIESLLGCLQYRAV